MIAFFLSNVVDVMPPLIKRDASTTPTVLSQRRNQCCKNAVGCKSFSSKGLISSKGYIYLEIFEMLPGVTPVTKKIQTPYRSSFSTCACKILLTVKPISICGFTVRFTNVRHFIDSRRVYRY